MIKIDGGSTAQYAYGPQGERVSKIAAGVTTYFYWGIWEKIGGPWTKLYVQGFGGKHDLLGSSHIPVRTFLFALRRLPSAGRGWRCQRFGSRVPGTGTGSGKLGTPAEGRDLAPQGQRRIASLPGLLAVVRWACPPGPRLDGLAPGYRNPGPPGPGASGSCFTACGRPAGPRTRSGCRSMHRPQEKGPLTQRPW